MSKTKQFDDYLETRLWAKEIKTINKEVEEELKTYSKFIFTYYYNGRERRKTIIAKNKTDAKRRFIQEYDTDYLSIEECL